MYEAGKFGFSGPFSFGDMKVRTLTFIQWHCWHRASSMRNFLSLNPKMETAVMHYFNVLRQD